MKSKNIELRHPLSRKFKRKFCFSWINKLSLSAEKEEINLN